MTRPALLFPLFTPLSALKGVGPRFVKLLGNLGLETIRDLAWLPPVGLIDRRYSPSLRAAQSGLVATIEGEIIEHRPAQRKGQPSRVVLTDGNGFLDIAIFNLPADYIATQFPLHQRRCVSGRLEQFQGRLQMSNPDYVVRPEERGQIPSVETVYPLTAGLTNKRLRTLIAEAQRHVPDLPEWNDAPLMKREGWKSWNACLKDLHTPDTEADLLPTSPTRRRLAYDEILANQLALALIRQHRQAQQGKSRAGSGKLVAALKAALPYALTGSQETAAAEIAQDLAAPTQMLRLLQGDVGAGKTIVALLSMLVVVEGGEQAALMAPTEILARQHYATLSRLCEPLGVRVALLTGREKGKSRTALEAEIAAGNIDIIIGTHALFQDSVTYARLGLAVIDEQHRFGVEQRMQLARKGVAVDMLVMTATPIPRTLVLSVYGDMSVSRLTEKPPGRTPIVTRVMSLQKADDVIAGLQRAMDAGARIYWVCPLVEESELIDLAAATSRYTELCQRFPNKVVLAHGKLPAAEKDAAMAAFASGAAQLLVATTVIEVGVDVPEASIMVIEHAERFGLAQLHQLRGRIGRGAAASTCLLLYGEPIGEVAKSRLATMRDTEDGFLIAEKDLELRGSGELLGTRQSGLPVMRHADLMVHQDLLAIAQADARLIIEKDPTLSTPRGQALRVLLHVHDRKTAAAYLRSG